MVLLRIESVLIEVNNSTVLIYLLLIRVLNSGSFFDSWNQNQEVSARKAEFIAIRILDTCWPLSASGRMVSLFPYTIFECGLLIDRQNRAEINVISDIKKLLKCLPVVYARIKKIMNAMIKSSPFQFNETTAVKDSGWERKFR